ncbi:MAG: hypothetical protein JXB15_06420 [Anaerolineales bacterium]|nr:hypothetical protein [Anaerolineales bacterium]
MTRPARVSLADSAALLLSLMAVLAGYLVGERVFENLAHIEDEQAYVWQAQAIAGGRLTLPTPPGQKSFLVPFVIDYHGQRFGKYPLGWPVLLAIGIRLGARSLVNPLLAGLGVWLTYLLGKRVFGEAVGLLAAVLTLTSPFFLMNAGSLLSHPLGLALSAAFALAWLEAFTPAPATAAEAASEDRFEIYKPWLATIAAGAALGMMALTRPLSAVGLALPFGLHGLYLLVWGKPGIAPSVRIRLLTVGLIAILMVSLHFAWQYAVTGDPFVNPYTLWWEYDRIGFGPGYGVTAEGHSLDQAWVNTRHSLWVGGRDLFGWGSHSWIFLPFGLLAVLFLYFRPRDLGILLRSGRDCLPALLLAGAPLSLGTVYLAYWIGSSLFGPRYFFESLYSLTIFSAAGIALLAGWSTRPGSQLALKSGWYGSWHRTISEGFQNMRPLWVTALVGLLVALNLVFYTPLRLRGMFGLYDVQRSHLLPFQSASVQQYTPALIIVHPAEDWIEYGRLLELQTPFLDTPFIFIISRGAVVDNQVAAQFPERRVYHYFPSDPYTFYIVLVDSLAPHSP